MDSGRRWRGEIEEHKTITMTTTVEIAHITLKLPVPQDQVCSIKTYTIK
jgi:hypothetical protein